jgi:hypothetical protein
VHKGGLYTLSVLSGIQNQGRLWKVCRSWTRAPLSTLTNEQTILWSSSGSIQRRVAVVMTDVDGANRETHGDGVQ